MPRQWNNRWFVVRLVAIAFNFFYALLFLRGFPAEEFARPSWLFLAQIIPLGAFAILFVVLLQKLNPLNQVPSSLLVRPSWSQNPFSLRSPLLFFHFAAWCLMSLGLGCLVFGLTRTPANWAWELPLGFGIGMWAGVRVASLMAGDDEANDA